MKQVRGEGFSVRFKRRPALAKKPAPRKTVPDSIRALFQMQAKPSFPPMPVLSAPANNAVETADISQAQKRLWIGAFKGDCHAIRIAVMEGADLNTRDKQGRTAINIATQYNHMNALKTLLAAREMKRMAALGDLPDTAFFRQFKSAPAGKDLRQATDIAIGADWP